MDIIKTTTAIDSDSRRGDNINRKRIKLVIAKSIDEFQEARCVHCHRLLFKVKGLQKGQIEVKCGKCGTFNIFN